jgi:hypothetical protein
MIPLRYRLQRSLEKNLPPLASALLGRLPRFAYGGALGDALPVFVYHAVDESFEADLRYLRAGGYRTVGAVELARYALTGRPHGRAVALTFDDGDRSLTDVAAPLLHAYGFRGIAFVVSGLVPDSADLGLSGWRELRAAVEQGSLEVGAHSLYHHHVPVGPRVIGVVDGATPADFRANIPVPRLRGDAVINAGMPILRGRPRYIARRSFRPAPGALGGWDAAGRPEVLAGEWETEAEAEQRVVEDMRQAMVLLEQRCPNPARAHLCYPWYAGDDWTDRMAGRAGAECVYGGMLAVRRLGKGELPPRLPRLDRSFLRCLPAPGRMMLPRVLARHFAAGLAGRGGDGYQIA